MREGRNILCCLNSYHREEREGTGAGTELTALNIIDAVGQQPLGPTCKSASQQLLGVTVGTKLATGRSPAFLLSPSVALSNSVCLNFPLQMALLQSSHVLWPQWFNFPSSAV